MDAFSVLSTLKTTGSVSLLLAVLCLIPIILITIKTTPSQLKVIIQIDERRRDPRHRKPVAIYKPDDEAIMKYLLEVSDARPLDNWQGSILGKEL